MATQLSMVVARVACRHARDRHLPCFSASQVMLRAIAGAGHTVFRPPARQHALAHLRARHRQKPTTLRHARYMASLTAIEPAHFTLDDSPCVELERDHGRLLKIVKRRAEEREALKAAVCMLRSGLLFAVIYRMPSQLSEDQSSPEDIPRLKRIRELEELGDAWRDYLDKRQVRSPQPYSTCLHSTMDHESLHTVVSHRNYWIAQRLGPNNALNGGRGADVASECSLLGLNRDIS
jgi:hypothetical protein